ncbi:DEAD/DEAH box helicase [Campylobacter sp. 2018MI13]|uniref:DEAD/DEAH box helicase n=1 Tax=Campylobacter sp. 2018MI13 TaxID=2836737 RepID=UPI001BDB4647|nr:DEAD/DEAH box helicase [Campylobacter sp. 2018MI13]MBT0882699.1 DEAD/DEAH box helicase [Campylobacter sp. 2018MI13]
MQANLYEYLINNKNYAKIIICEDLNEAKSLSNVALYLGINSFILPDFRAEINDDLRSFSMELFDISKVLSDYYDYQDKKILIIPINTIKKPLPSKDDLKCLKIEFGDRINLNSLAKELLRLNYNLVDMVQSPGEFSIGHEKIDIFSLKYENPIRIVLFDDEVESIKYFDASSGLSYKEEREYCDILPLISYVSEEKYEEIKESILNNDDLNEYESVFYWHLKLSNYLEFSYVCTKEFELGNIISKAKKYSDMVFNPSNDFFKLNSNKKIKLLASNENKFLDYKLGENVEKIISNAVLNIQSDDELILSLNKYYKKEKKYKSSIVLDELIKNDYVVHERYGVGRFLGLELIENEGKKQEFIVIEYQNENKLLLPTSSLYLLDKYISSSIPELDKLGKNTFVKLKEKLKTKLLAIAGAITELAAKRQLIVTKAIKKPLDYEIFKAKAGFVLTSDQEKAVNDIFEEISKCTPMDRLLSADVGFGKTEVAMHAIFACVKNGLNALFFVPTTLLCSQHYKTLKNRLEPFGIQVFRLDRFSNTKKAIMNTKEPKVIIGTHALLSLAIDDVGLIVIDEEHKFGVKQKEKLKDISIKAHQLSMSATPIPRTLNQALSTLKTYSQILTPPNDRLDVRTFVKTYDDALIKEIIARELRRGGQVFYIHNHIASIEHKKRYLEELYPKLRILVLHSKIPANEAEEKLFEYEEKKYDLLLCTSIVESGIDLANANTIIVEKSNHFGIADLHQLRGRVGRSKIQGFCYFLVDNEESVSEDSKKRLLSLASNSYLGSGSTLAQMDLEIRGGGNLLGAEQSGHIEQLGYALYIKMLEAEINRLSKGNITKEIKYEQKLLVNAYISDYLVPNDKLRLSLYRKINECDNLASLSTMQDSFNDRFGKCDSYTRNYFSLMAIKILCIKHGFCEVSNYEQNIKLLKDNGERIILKASSKSDDDIIDTLLKYLNSL